MRRVLIRLSNNDLEAIANGIEIEIETNNVGKIVLTPAITQDVALPIINDPVKLVNTTINKQRINIMESASW
ncbi:hypothetical protein ACQV2T_04150 [Facklamia sp. P13069]|uniref:hypothetical protein n=1 Tax=Facklamia sp. P13069 TaxID=3421954 RepID=UPI003D171B12